MNWGTLKARLTQAFGHQQSPHTLAASWACGVAIGLSPFMGFHTILALLLAFALRLNKVDVLVGTLLINPWTFPVYSVVAVSLGTVLTGKPVPLHVHPSQLAELLDPAFWRAQEAALAPLLLNWSVGAMVCSLVGGIAVYTLARWAIVYRRRLCLPSR